MTQYYNEDTVLIWAEDYPTIYKVEQAKAEITRDLILLEQLEANGMKFLTYGAPPQRKDVIRVIFQQHGIEYDTWMAERKRLEESFSFGIKVE